MRGEIHYPGHNFTGPGTQLKTRLERGDEPVNAVDELSLHHDMRYEFYGDNMFEVFRADVQFIGGAIGIVFAPRSSMKERGQAVLVGSIMTMKIVSDVFMPGKRIVSIGRALRKLKPLEKII